MNKVIFIIITYLFVNKKEIFSSFPPNFLAIKSKNNLLDMNLRAFNPGTWEAETSRSLWMQSHLVCISD